MKFTQEIKEKWLTALRSGEYKQTTQTLYDPKNDSYCCMGVLGVICGMDKNELAQKDMFYVPNYRKDDRTIDSDLIPDIMKYRTMGAGIPTKPVTLNDEGSPFSEIADYIEQNIPAEE